MRVWQITLMVLFTSIGLVTAARADAMTASLRGLLIEYRCEVVGRLEQIYHHVRDDGDQSSYRDRFLAVSVPARSQSYVQCMFIESRSKVVCEASSGFHATKSDEPRTHWLPAEAVSALARLGFSTDDSAGNFQRISDVTSPPDFNALADLILAALHNAYGARAHISLLFNAPFAPGTITTCIPLS